MAKEGETRSATPGLEAEGAKTELGEVSAWSTTVFHTVAAPVAVVVHPEGRTGAITESKFCAKSGPRVPRIKLKLTVPRLAAPSCNCKVARPGVPQTLLA